MTRDDVLRREETRARAAGRILSDGTRYGSVNGHRTLTTTPPTSRRRCACCNRRSTHVGLGDGVALMSGCEMTVRRWVRDGHTGATTAS